VSKYKYPKSTRELLKQARHKSYSRLYKFRLYFASADGLRHYHEQKGIGSRDPSVCVEKAFAAAAQLYQSGDTFFTMEVRNRATGDVAADTGQVNITVKKVAIG